MGTVFVACEESGVTAMHREVNPPPTDRYIDSFVESLR
jgi:NAD(P)H-dependent flavin oxidoreductase YrpB (nitropropane dioxygenase family)